MTTSADFTAIFDSLEQCAARDIDLTNAIFERFYAACDTAESIMSNTDQYMRGRMLEQVFELIMDEPNNLVHSYLNWELENHLLAYGVPISTYAPLLEAVHGTVRNTLADDWSTDYERAWTARSQELLQKIDLQAQELTQT